MNSKREAVVVMPGIWLPYWTMYLLKRRIARRGYDAYISRYHSVAYSLEQNAQRLDKFLKNIDADTIHLVSQSLGGIVIRAMFHYFPEQKPGRIVTFVPPHMGTYTGALFSRSVVGRLIIGKGILQLVRGIPKNWTLPEREFAVIAGNRPIIGMGLLAPGLPKPHDGVVSVNETLLPGITEHVVLPVGHTPSIISRLVADNVLSFLEKGKFV